MRLAATERSIEREYRLIAVIGGKGAAPGRFLSSLRGVALNGDGRTYAVGDRDVKVFDEEGKLLRRWGTSKPGISVAVHEGRVFVGESGRIEVFGTDGKPLARWDDRTNLGLVTSIVPYGEEVFAADARAQRIRRLDSKGRLLASIGREGRRGFSVPGGYLDFAIDVDGIIHAANPGKHRVERYAPSGELLGQFGHFGMHDPADFRGCCNPTNIAVTADGSIVVTEKAAPRAKVYDRDGGLLAVFGEDLFDPGCKYLDVAVDDEGRIFVADTARLEIRVFEASAVEPSAVDEQNRQVGDDSSEREGGGRDE